MAFRATVILLSEENTALFSQDLEKIRKVEEIECPNAVLQYYFASCLYTSVATDLTFFHIMKHFTTWLPWFSSSDISLVLCLTVP